MMMSDGRVRATLSTHIEYKFHTAQRFYTIRNESHVKFIYIKFSEINFVLIYGEML